MALNKVKDVALDSEKIGNLSVFANVKASTYGATGDGVTNDTTALQNAFNSSFTTIRIPAGTYMVDAVTKLRVPSNKTIIFEQGAILKVIPNNSDSYRVLDLFAAENVTLINPTLIGDKDTHLATDGGGSGHGIYLSTAKNINIYNPTCNDFWGDGLVVTGGENVYMENVLCNNNKRQGISIIRAKNLTVNGALLTNIGGFAPGAGIDLEPNYDTDYLENIRLINVTTINTTLGIHLVPVNLMQSQHNITIEIVNHKSYNSTFGFSVASMVPAVQQMGRIVLDNCYYEGMLNSGFSIRDYQDTYSPPLIIKNTNVINPNRNNTPTQTFGGNGIYIYRPNTSISTLKMGNIHIENLRVLDVTGTPYMLNAVFIQDDKAIGTNKINIINPLDIKGFVNHGIAFDANTDATVLDDLNTTALNVTTQFSNIDNAIYSKITNVGSTIVSQFNYSSAFKHTNKIKFVNYTTQGMIIIPTASQNILPLSSVNGKYITTTQIGASITIRKVNSSSYFIEEMIGTWTVQP